MKEAYSEIMERVVVTAEMRARILEHIHDAHGRPAPTQYVPQLRRWAAAAACVVILITGALTLPQFLNPNAENPSPPVQGGLHEITKVSSHQALEQTVGFSVLEVTGLPFAVETVEYTAFGTQMAQIVYSGEGQSAVFRQAPGEEDPSGDYTSYADVAAADVGGCTVTLKGESGQYVLALWQDEDCAYSLQLSLPLASEQWEALLQTVCG